MKNMMKEYLGKEYSDNHLRNFCLYWMKYGNGSGDEWRKNHDLDCLYFNGDLRADTLMSAWTPIKWVAEFIAMNGKDKFYKRAQTGDPYYDLKLLADRGEEYLPPEHVLVKMLNRFLELAEQRCNYILLPARNMNPERYKSFIRGTEVWLLDEVPATLSNVFDRKSLGRYFLNDDWQVDKEAVIRWIKREHLEMGFEWGEIDPDHVIPLIPDKSPKEGIWPRGEREIFYALMYMTCFLEKRMIALTAEENNLMNKEID